MFPVFSPLTAPNTPGWLLVTVVVVGFTAALGSIIWGQIQEFRYTRPYQLAGASSASKWRFAAVIAFWHTIWLPIVGLVQPVLSPLPDQWPAFPLFCGGVWIAVYPIVLVFKRWSLEWQLSYYRWVGSLIKTADFRRIMSVAPFRWLSWIQGAEDRHFFREGYSSNTRQKTEKTEEPH